MNFTEIPGEANDRDRKKALLGDLAAQVHTYS
jgi:hypothetical protein